MSALTDNCIHVLIGQIHFIFFDSGFLGILLNGNADINQAAAQRSGTQTALTLVCLIDDDGELTTTEFLHVLLGK